MITYGFFNSVDGDRKYNADTIGAMFEGLIGDGIYESIGQKFHVSAGTGMTVTVGTGRAIVNTKWVKNGATETVDITAADSVNPRYTAIVLRHDIANRLVSLAAVDGIAEASPDVPTVVRNSQYYDIMLAYILIPAASTAIDAANITDTRSDNTRCGWVTGLVEQVDTSDLFDQYEAAYEAAMDEMDAFEGRAEDRFDAWLNSFTGQLKVPATMKKYNYTGTVTDSVIPWSAFNGYYYDEHDVILVAVDGVLLSSGYTVSSTGITFSSIGAAAVANVTIIKMVSEVAGNLSIVKSVCYQESGTTIEDVKCDIKEGHTYIVAFFVSDRDSLAMATNNTSATWHLFETKNYSGQYLAVGVFTASADVTNYGLLTKSGTVFEDCVVVYGVWEYYSGQLVTTDDLTVLSSDVDPLGGDLVLETAILWTRNGVESGDSVRLQGVGTGSNYVTGQKLVMGTGELVTNIPGGYAQGAYAIMQIGLFEGTGAVKIDMNQVSTYGDTIAEKLVVTRA